MISKKILVVEDERIAAEDIKQTLQRLGYDVCSVVSTGKDAIKKAQELQPDLVLMDIVLEGKMTGIEAAEEIYSKLNIPVIYLTAYADEATLQQAKLTKPLGYIVKPFSERELRTVIEVALYRSEMERNLREQKEWFYTTLKSIGDAVIATNNKGKIIFMNPMAERLTGWKQEEALGWPLERVFNIVNEDTGEPIENPVRKVIERGTIVGLGNHTMLISKKGKKIPIDDSASPIKDDQGNLLGIVLIFRDVTQRRKIEQEFLKRSKLEAIGFLAGGIAHDFNNILTAILGNIELAKMETTPEDKLFKRLLTIEKAVFQAKQIAQQMLAFSKGGLPIKKTCSIEKILKDTATLCLSGSDIKLEFCCASDLWLVEIDEGQIAQVINNLIINSIQAMTHGGTLRIKARNIVISEPMRHENNLPLEPGKYVKISIQDQGEGIPKEHLDKIFDPFFTTKPGGSGLGLAVVYFVIKNHNGYITVESEVGKGTTFHIYLPASKRATLDEREKSEKVIKGKGRILLMDDEEIIREVVGELLTQLGYEPDFAKDGQEAIEKYIQAQREGKPFKAVIMDLTIPGGMGGKEALQKLLKIDPEIKVIVSSGYSDDPIMTNYKQHGFKGVIAKPYRLTELSKTLNQLLKEDKK